MVGDPYRGHRISLVPGVGYGEHHPLFRLFTLNPGFPAQEFPQGKAVAEAPLSEGPRGSFKEGKSGTVLDGEAGIGPSQAQPEIGQEGPIRRGGEGEAGFEIPRPQGQGQEKIVFQGKTGGPDPRRLQDGGAEQPQVVGIAGTVGEGLEGEQD
jgi:hypothetical protein